MVPYYMTAVDANTVTKVLTRDYVIRAIQMTMTAADATADDKLFTAILTCNAVSTTLATGRTSTLGVITVGSGSTVAPTSFTSMNNSWALSGLWYRVYEGDIIQLDMSVEEGSLGGSDFRVAAVIWYDTMEEIEQYERQNEKGSQKRNGIKKADLRWPK